MQTDWATVKMEYEIMHHDVEELSKRHHISESIINTAIETEGWKRQSSDDMALEELSERLSAVTAYHEWNLVPKFITLQAKMLDRCDSLLDSVVSIDDAPNLRIVSEVIEKHRPAVLGVPKDGGAKDNQMTVRVLTKVGDGPDVSTSAVEITQKAGESNGVGALTKY